MGSSPPMTDNSSFHSTGHVSKTSKLKLSMDLGLGLQLWSNVGKPWHWHCE